MNGVVQNQVLTMNFRKIWYKRKKSPSQIFFYIFWKRVENLLLCLTHRSWKSTKWWVVHSSQPGATANDEIFNEMARCWNFLWSRKSIRGNFRYQHKQVRTAGKKKKWMLFELLNFSWKKSRDLLDSFSRCAFEIIQSDDFSIDFSNYYFVSRFR